MDRRLSVHTLPRIAPVVYMIFFGKIDIAAFCPGLSPQLGIGFVVPVIGGYIDPLPQHLPSLALSLPKFLISVLVQNGDTVLCRVLFILQIIRRLIGIIDRPSPVIFCIGKDSPCLLIPLMVFVYAPAGQHYMGMWIAISFIMKRPVSYHTLRCEVLLYVSSDTIDLLDPVHFHGKCYLDFSCEPSIAASFHLLNIVPQLLPVMVFFRRILRQQYLTHDYPALCREVMDDTCFMIRELLS